MSKNILITAFDFPPQIGGVATYSWELANSLSQKGHKVTVITKDRQQSYQDNFTVISWKLPRFGVLALPALTLRLVNHLKKNQYDHIFSTLWLPDGAAVYLAKKLLKNSTPTSISVHAMEILDSRADLKKRIRSRLKNLKRNSFNDCQSIFCVSNFSKQLLLNNISVDADKVHVVNNGVNLERFYRAESKPAPYPQLMTTCRLIPTKGIDKVISCLPQLKKVFPDISYKVVGTGPDLTRLKQLAQMNHVEEQVQFLGKIEHQQLIDLYNQSDLHVMLSRQNSQQVEGFGLVFLEAALCGTASLGGDSGGIPDAIKHNETGWLVDPYDSENIAQKLQEILSDQDYLRKISEQAHQFTLKRSWGHQTQLILQKAGL